MFDFFRERFEYMHQLNLGWIHHLTKADLPLPVEVEAIISNILNINHIWAHRMIGTVAESELDDRQPEHYWEALEIDNGRAWELFFLSLENGIIETKHPSEETDVEQEMSVLLFHALKENAYLIGQLQWVCQKNELVPFNERFIVLG